MSMAKFTFSTREGSKPDLYLYYYQTCGHYESLLVSKDTALTLRTKAAAGRTTGGRQSRGGAINP